MGSAKWQLRGRSYAELGETSAAAGRLLELLGGVQGRLLGPVTPGRLPDRDR
jgi:hypothetical protein